MVGPLREQGTKEKGKKREGVRKGEEWNALSIGTLRWHTTEREMEFEIEWESEIESELVSY